jgi:hypothetical protein
MTAKIDFAGPVMPGMSSACWEWNGSRHGKGYGHVSVAGRIRKAHRVVYELLVGPIPDGLQLDHLCRNRCCVNPDHLEPVTARTNIRRGEANAAINARKTHCDYGHPFAGENLRLDARGNRQCWICERSRARDRTRRYRERLKARAA